jgi:hypothetical protein
MSVVTETRTARTVRPTASAISAAANLLFVGVALRVGDAGAGGHDRGEAGILEHAGAGRVPRIREDQERRGSMKLRQGGGFVFHRDS